MRNILTLLLVLFALSAYSQNNYSNWYVSPDLGADALINSGGQSTTAPFKTIQFAHDQSNPGDTVFIMEGTYRNSGYNFNKVPGVSPDRLFNPFLVNLTRSGNDSQGHITYINYPGHNPRIEFDGAGGFKGNGVSYIRIIGLNIEGAAENITIDEAMAHRLDSDVPSYYNGEGIWFKRGSHHIIVKDCDIKYCTASGIKSSGGDYILFKNNIVQKCTWFTIKATKGIVINRAEEVDTESKSKIIVMNNLLFENWNNIPFYKGIPGDVYGGADHTRIVDGHGLTITQCNDPELSTDYEYGRILVQGNICVRNGINGISFNKSSRGDFINNTIYHNNVQPGTSSLGGLKARKSDDVYFANNLIVGNNENEYPLTIEEVTNFKANNNLIFSGKTHISGQLLEDPKLVDPSNDPFFANYNLLSSSPAIDAGIAFTPNIPEYFTDEYNAVDFAGQPRLFGNAIDIGAYEYQGPTAVLEVEKKGAGLQIFPNPATSGITTIRWKTDEPHHQVMLKIFSFRGALLKTIALGDVTIGEFSYKLNLDTLESGVYFLTIISDLGTLTKQMVVLN